MPRRSTRFYRRNEEEVMKQLGFTPTINSGAGWIQKEDGENEEALCQLKSTDKMSISINQNDLHVLEQNAFVSHKLPIFAIQYLNTGEVWVMVKPEHIKLLQCLVQGKDIKQELNKHDIFADECYKTLDIEQEKEYNVFKGRALEARKAREEYLREKEQEAEKQKKQWKERRSSWKSNLNKKE